MSTKEVGPPPKFFVVAIDLGISYSAYAFSSDEDHKKDPLKIKTSLWSSGSHLSHKTPTSLLLNPEKSAVAFGFDAERKLKEIAKKSKDESKRYYYFELFTKCVTKDLSEKSTFDGQNGEKVLATKVFGETMQILKKDLFIKFKFGDIEEMSVYYVITVSATWGTHSKQMIKDAAYTAGIAKDRLSIISQPEAASLYIQHVSKAEKPEKALLSEKQQKEKDLAEGGDLTVLKGAILFGYSRRPKPVPTRQPKPEKPKIKDPPKKDTGATFEQKILEAEKQLEIKPEEVKQFQQTLKKKYKYFEEGPVEVTPAVLEKGLSTNIESKLFFNEVTEQKLDEDNKDIEKMANAAKVGSWKDVWEILDRKCFLVNCIPEQRAWSSLHQAIYQGNLSAVKKLVEVYGADTTVCTKPDLQRVAEPGTDALSLAESLDKEEIYLYLLKETILNKHVVNSQDISFFVLHKHGDVYPFKRYPLFQITLASYKSMLIRDKTHQVDQTSHMANVAKVIHVHSDSEWESTKVKIRSTLYGIDRGHSEYLMNATSKTEFFQMVIRLYTEESVYHHLTPALLRQPRMPYKPIAADLAVGPFALVLSTILLYWEGVNSYSDITYRGVEPDVTDKYKVGDTLVFHSFISSSKLRSVAEKFSKDTGTLFVFSNYAVTRWRPRSIKKYSRFPSEEECLYPLGAEFKVMTVDKSSREVCLKLLDPSM